MEGMSPFISCQKRGGFPVYANFAYIYDRLMSDVDYSRWADHIQGIFRKYSFSPRLVLDLGCGTGSLCLELTKRGYEMIGIDSSADMLSCARNKFEAEGFDVLLINQDMTDFELYGTVDAIVCTMDSINYVTDSESVVRLFKLVRNYLNPGGLFIFDVNTLYKLKNILGNNVFYSTEDDIAYIWQNRFNSKKRTCEFELTFFVKNGELYTRFEETHVEKAFTQEEIEKFIDGSGLRLLDVFDDLSFEKPSEKSERIFFICRG